MNATINSSFQCECGSVIYMNGEEFLFCLNPDCAHLGKKFKRPTIKLDEA